MSSNHFVFLVLSLLGMAISTHGVGDGCGPGGYCLEAPKYTCGGTYICQPYDPSTCPSITSIYWDVPAWCTANCYRYGGSCSRCPADKVTTVWGVTSSAGCVCPPGQAGGPNTTPCTQCPAGSYCPQVASGVASSISCPGGTYSNAGQSVCTQCGAGKSSVSGSSSCTSCAPGRYSNAGATVCTQCNAGKYASGTGASSCASCPTAGISNTDFTQCTIPINTPFRLKVQTSNAPYISQYGNIGGAGAVYVRTEFDPFGSVGAVVDQWKYMNGVNGGKVITNVWYSSENTVITFQDHQIGVNDIASTVAATINKDYWEHFEFQALPNGKWLILSAVNGGKRLSLREGALTETSNPLETTTTTPGAREEFEIILV